MIGFAGQARPRASRAPALIGGLLAAALTLSACNEVETTTAEPYQPASLSEADATGVKTVTLTEPAAKAIELRSTPVRDVGGQKVIPYEALIYDGSGRSWVYTVVGKLAYRRVTITVAEVREPSVVLSAGPAVGTPVVTQGSTEVYGAELEMEGSH